MIYITYGFFQLAVLMYFPFIELVKNIIRRLKHRSKVGRSFMCEKSLHPK